jgi:hypothetical protein
VYIYTTNCHAIESNLNQNNFTAYNCKNVAENCHFNYYHHFGNTLIYISKLNLSNMTSNFRTVAKFVA